MHRIEILNRLTERSEGIRRMDEFHSPEFFNFDCQETGKVRPGWDANQEFSLTATLTVTFWANRAQYACAREIAERALVHRLYADVLGELSELRLQITNGDKQASLEACARLESKLYLK